MRRGCRSNSVPLQVRQPSHFQGYWRPLQGLRSIVQPASALLVGAAGSGLPEPEGPHVGLPLGSMVQPPLTPSALVHTPRSQLQKPERSGSRKERVSLCARGLEAGCAAVAHQGSARIKMTARTAAFLRNMSCSSWEVEPAASNGRRLLPVELGCWSKGRKIHHHFQSAWKGGKGRWRRGSAKKR